MRDAGQEPATGVPPDSGIAAGRLARFASEWAAALAGTSYVPMSSSEVTDLLGRHAGTLAAIARRTPFCPEQAAQVGAALVSDHFVGAAAIGRSLGVIGRNLPRVTGGRRTPGRAERLRAVQDAVAAGYVTALRDRTLAEQESIRRADITALEQRLRYQALHDPLTGLPNRRLFFDRLAAALLEPDNRIGICYVDLDGFKSINDTLGHAAGDELLAAVARRLERRSGRRGGFVARMGGDEFVLLVERSAGIGELVTLAGDLLTRIEEPFQLSEHRVRISASIGIVERPTAGTSAADIIKDADNALYWAKAEGPGRWAVFDPAKEVADSARLTLAASMHTALDRGEFTIAYQPIVDLPHRVLRGAEALVRWNHPALGTLPPQSFIAIAEATGVITPLGRWVTQAACRQAQAWGQIRPESALYVSVNVSAVQAANPGLADEVATILKQAGLPPHRLQLEITESAIAAADGRPVESLQELSAMGVRIAVDDFGTGYSNLASLRRLPVDALKLSASFIREVWPEGLAKEPIITSLTSLAHTLGLTITVEGVENAEQAECLADLGCDSAQGWYFGRPLPGEHISILLRGTGRPSPRPARQSEPLLLDPRPLVPVLENVGGERDQAAGDRQSQTHPERPPGRAEDQAQAAGHKPGHHDRYRDPGHLPPVEAREDDGGSGCLGHERSRLLRGGWDPGILRRLASRPRRVVALGGWLGEWLGEWLGGFPGDAADGARLSLVRHARCSSPHARPARRACPRAYHCDQGLPNGITRPRGSPRDRGGLRGSFLRGSTVRPVGTGSASPPVSPTMTVSTERDRCSQAIQLTRRP